MTDHAGGPALSSAYAAIDPLCIKVGLSRTHQLPRVDGTAEAPHGIALWSSPYARLLLWPCQASDAPTVEATANEAQRWFDEVLISGERIMRGRPLDGYLVLALPTRPGDEAREDVRRLELSAQVCRKHLIWPSAPEDADHAEVPWRRVADITVVGLPDAELVPGEELQWPAIDTEAKALWEELDAIGVSAVLLKDDAA